MDNMDSELEHLLNQQDAIMARKPAATLQFPRPLPEHRVTDLLNYIAETTSFEEPLIYDNDNLTRLTGVLRMPIPGLSWNFSAYPATQHDQWAGLQLYGIECANSTYMLRQSMNDFFHE